MSSIENDIKINIKNILKNSGECSNKEIADKLSYLKRESIPNAVITIGIGSSSIIAGAIDTLNAIKNYISTKNIKADVIETGNLGFCSEEPVIGVQLPGKNLVLFKRVDAKSVEFIFDAIFSNDIISNKVLCQVHNSLHHPWEDIPYMEDLPFFALQRRNLLRNCGFINPESIYEYIARGGYKSFVKSIINYPCTKVCEIIEESELRGRGGSGFLTGLKWKIALTSEANNKFVICNADESDPGAFTNIILLEGDPHRLIEGIAIASYAIGADKAYIYIRSRHNLAYQRLNKAIQDAKELGLLGYDIFNSGVNINIIIKQSPGAYVCGEETALIASLEGKRGMPVTRPPYPAVKGFNGMPTVINNVETLANIPDIIDKGPAWFKNSGTFSSKGTKLFSLGGKVKNCGVVEVPMGISLKDIVFKIGEGVKDDNKFKALLIGGPSGYFVPEHKLNIEIDYEKLRDEGFSIGTGGLVVIDESGCIVEITKFFMEFTARESCGKCIPCREGTKIMSDILHSVTRKPVNGSGHETLERFKGVMQLEGLADVIKNTALCGLGKNAANPLVSSMKWFKEEYEEHIFDRKCYANVCKQLRCFKIDAENCNGCNICFQKCPEKAIIGTVLQPHFIISNKCTGCGICYDNCKFSAIVVV